jgi:hypothetical protein
MLSAPKGVIYVAGNVDPAPHSAAKIFLDRLKVASIVSPT